MKKLIFNTQHKIGVAPGTLTYSGTEAHKPVKIQYWAGRKDEDEDLRPIKPNQLPLIEPYSQWYNIEGLHDIELLRSLGEKFGIHALFLEDILNDSERPKVETIEDCLFVSVKALQLEGTEIKARTVSFVVTQETLFSFSELESDAWLEPIKKRLKNPKGTIRTRGVYYLLYALIDVLVDQYLFVLERIGDEIETVDLQVVKSAEVVDLDTLYQLKKELLYLRKQTSPVTDFIRKMANDVPDKDWKPVKIYFDDLLGHSLQVQDIIHTYLDGLSNLFDLYFSLVNLRMNRTIQALTVITVVFLPLSLLAGIYGMNFLTMPGLKDPQAFWWMMGMMLLIATGILLFLKHKRWF